MTANSQWLVWALLSAVFAAATAILAKAGVQQIDADLATLLRTLVITALLAGFGRLFGGTLDRMKEVRYFRFRELQVRRDHPAPLQLDGELIPEARRVHLRVQPAALRVLVPPAPAAADAPNQDGRAVPS